MKQRVRLALALTPIVLGCLAAWRSLPAADPPAKPDNAAPPSRPLLPIVRKGMVFLLKQQQADGGWDGGSPMMGFPNPFLAPAVPPRVGAPKPGGPAAPAMQSDVGDTSIALLALLRAGYSPKGGDQSAKLAKALSFLCAKVEASDEESLTVGDVPTLVQMKIGPFADTFLAAMALAEAKGKMPDEKSEKRVVEALEKIVKKMTKNQKNDGTWEAKSWAPVLSQALASRAINRAHQVGIAVDQAVLEKTAEHARKELENLNKALKNIGGDAGGRPALGGRPGGAVGGAPGGGVVIGAPLIGAPFGPGFGPGLMGGLEGAAGVSLYATATHISGMMDNVATQHNAATGARGVLSSPTATEKQRGEAKVQIEHFDKVHKELNQAMTTVSKQALNPAFIRGFGSDGGEEFLSFMLMGETLHATKNKNSLAWNRAITQRLVQSQNANSSWSGKHCITGSTFCTATAMLALMTDRSPLPVVPQAGDK